MIKYGVKLINIIGILMIVFGWFINKHYQFVYNIFAPKYEKAIYAYNKIQQQGFILKKSDTGFTEITEILKKNITLCLMNTPTCFAFSKVRQYLREDEEKIYRIYSQELGPVKAAESLIDTHIIIEPYIVPSITKIETLSVGSIAMTYTTNKGNINIHPINLKIFYSYNWASTTPSYIKNTQHISSIHLPPFSTIQIDLFHLKSEIKKDYLSSYIGIWGNIIFWAGIAVSALLLFIE